MKRLSKFSRIILAALLLSGNLPAASAAPKAPDFTGTGVDGKTYSLSQYQGKDLVLYFWATWCPACRRDAEGFMKVYETYNGKAAEIVTVSLDKGLDKLKAFVEEKKVPYPILFGGKSWDNPIAEAYHVDSTPTYILISKDGEIIRKGAFSSELETDLVRLRDKGAADFLVAPDFSGTDLQGIHHSLSDYKGKKLVLYFWATWCPACRQDTPNIRNLIPDLQAKGVEFVSISLDKEKDKLQAYIKDNALTFPVIFGGKSWDDANVNAYGIHSTPSYVLISPAGALEGTGHWSEEIRAALLS